MSQRDSIIEELSVKLQMLIRRYNELETQYNQLAAKADFLQEENRTLRQINSDAKAAKAISLGDADLKETHLRITRLIHEVDKCIALLSV